MKGFFIALSLFYTIASNGQIKPEIVLQSGHGGTIQKIDVDSSSNFLISTDQNSKAILWDINSHLQLAVFDSIDQALFSEDKLVLLNKSQVLKKYSLKNRDFEKTTMLGVTSFHVISSGIIIDRNNGIACNINDSISPIELEEPIRIVSKKGQDSFLYLKDESIMAYDITTGESSHIHSSSTHEHLVEVHSLEKIRFGVQDNGVIWKRVEDRKTSTKFFNLKGYKESVIDFDVDKHGRSVLLTSNGALIILNENCHVIGQYQLSKKSKAVQFCNNGKSIIYSSGKAMFMIDSETGIHLKSFHGFDSEISVSAFTEDDDGILVGMRNGDMRYIPIDPLSNGKFLRMPRRIERNDGDWIIAHLGVSNHDEEATYKFAYLKSPDNGKHIEKAEILKLHWNLLSGKYSIVSVQNLRFKKESAMKSEAFLKKYADKKNKSKNYEHQLSMALNEGTMVLKTNEQKLLYLRIFGEKGKLYSFENYYYANKEVADYVSFKVDDEIYHYEQFDPYLNDPDRVFENTGIFDSALIETFKLAKASRIKNLGGKSILSYNKDDVPSIEVITPNNPLVNDSIISFRIKSSSRANLSSLQININNVPVFGKNGKEIKGTTYDDEVSLNLKGGINEIKIFTKNELGYISKILQYSVFANYSFRQNLFVISVGVSEYSDKAYNLNYAVKDAKDFSSTFMGTRAFSTVNNLCLENPSKDEILNRSKEFLKNVSVNDVVLFYYAGHGVLDERYNYYLCPTDINFLNPSKNGLEFDVLEQTLAESNSLSRIIFLDACHSGEIDKDELIAMEKEVEEIDDLNFRSVKNTRFDLKSGVSYLDLSKSLFQDTRENHGNYIISSANGVEFAVESGKWKNGLFTYYVKDAVQSMKADFDESGTVDLIELFDFVSSQVEIHSSGKQHPQVRTRIRFLNPELYK